MDRQWTVDVAVAVVAKKKYEVSAITRRWLHLSTAVRLSRVVLHRRLGECQKLSCSHRSPVGNQVIPQPHRDSKRVFFVYCWLSGDYEPHGRVKVNIFWEGTLALQKFHQNIFGCPGEKPTPDFSLGSGQSQHRPKRRAAPAFFSPRW